MGSQDGAESQPQTATAFKEYSVQIPILEKNPHLSLIHKLKVTSHGGLGISPQLEVASRLPCSYSCSPDVTTDTHTFSETSVNNVEYLGTGS